MYILLETEIEKYAKRTRSTDIIGVYFKRDKAEKEMTKLINEFLEFHDLDRKKILDTVEDFWKCEVHEKIYLIEIEEQDAIMDEERYLSEESKDDLDTYFDRDVFYIIKLISKDKVEYVRSINGNVINVTLIEEKARKYKSIRYLTEVYLPMLNKIDNEFRVHVVDKIIRTEYRNYRENIKIENEVRRWLGAVI